MSFLFSCFYLFTQVLRPKNLRDLGIGAGVRGTGARCTTRPKSTPLTLLDRYA